MNDFNEYNNADDLHDVEAQLRAARPSFPPAELDRIKLRALAAARMSGPTAGNRLGLSLRRSLVGLLAAGGGGVAALLVGLAPAATACQNGYTGPGNMCTGTTPVFVATSCSHSGATATVSGTTDEPTSPGGSGTSTVKSGVTGQKVMGTTTTQTTQTGTTSSFAPTSGNGTPYTWTDTRAFTGGYGAPFTATTSYLIQAGQTVATSTALDGTSC
jgi:hypothetical protein